MVPNDTGQILPLRSTQVDFPIRWYYVDAKPTGASLIFQSDFDKSARNDIALHSTLRAEIDLMRSFDDSGSRRCS